MSHRPDNTAEAEEENRQKQAQKAYASKSKKVHTSELGEVCNKLICIDGAQLLGLWGQWLAAIVNCWLPMVARGFPHNVYRLLETLIQQEEAESDTELLPSM
jgi:hypothetical protein